MISYHFFSVFVEVNVIFIAINLVLHQQSLDFATALVYIDEWTPR